MDLMFNVRKLIYCKVVTETAITYSMYSLVNVLQRSQKPHVKVPVSLALNNAIYNKNNEVCLNVHHVDS